MDNKLSELSKPVAYDYQIADACIADGHNENGKWVDWNNKLSRYCPPDWMVEEGKVTDLKPLYSQEYVSALTQRIAELEAKLATPVQLPDIRSDDYHETGWFQHMKYYRDVERSVLTAGFTIEGE